VLDRHQRVVTHLDDVGPPLEPPALRPERNRSEHPTPAFHPALPRISPPMQRLPTDRVPVVHPLALDIDEPTLARAVHVVLEGGDPNGQRVIHSSSEEYALV